MEARNEHEIEQSFLEQRLIQKEDISEHKQVEKIEESIKTTRIKEDDSQLEEKAVDSLFDKEGIGNKDSLSEQKKEETVLRDINHLEKKAIERKENSIVQRHKRETKNDLDKKASKNVQKKSTTIDIKKKESESKNKVEPKLPEATLLIETDITKTIMEYPLGPAHTVVVQEISPIDRANENIASSTESNSSSEINNIESPVSDKEIKDSILLTEPYGDLKFELKIEGGLNNELKTYIVFKEYPKKNRRLLPKKSEINISKIEPFIIEKAENITTLIINQVKDGVYELIVEPLNKVEYKKDIVLRLISYSIIVILAFSSVMIFKSKPLPEKFMNKIVDPLQFQLIMDPIREYTPIWATISDDVLSEKNVDKVSIISGDL